MKSNFSVSGKVHEEVIELVRSCMIREGFIILSENDLNEENSNKESFYRFVIDCNPRIASELERNGLVPNLPYLNLTVQSTNEMKSEIRFDDLDLTLTDLQLKRFKPIIPLIDNYLNQAMANEYPGSKNK